MNREEIRNAIMNYVRAPCFDLPKQQQLFYIPTFPCDFSAQGESMVIALCEVSVRLFR